MRVVSGDHRVERLVVDGLGLRRLPGADGRRRADEGHVAGIAMASSAKAISSLVLTDIPATRITRRHGLQGGRHRSGMTALQMDIKIQRHHHRDRKALAQARKPVCTSWPRWSRPCPRREDQVRSSPRACTPMKINPEKIRDVIGRAAPPSAALTEETGQIDIGRRTAPSPSPDRWPKGPNRRSASLTHRRGGGRRSTKARSTKEGLRALVNLAGQKGTACCTSSLRTSGSRRSPTSRSEGQIVKVRSRETDEKGRQAVDEGPDRGPERHAKMSGF